MLLPQTGAQAAGLFAERLRRRLLSVSEQAGLPVRASIGVAALTADEVSARIARDVASGEATGVIRGTPTLFIDGVLHTGGYDRATLLEALAR